MLRETLRRMKRSEPEAPPTPVRTTRALLGDGDVGRVRAQVARRLSASSRVLEIGCGLGELALALGRCGSRVDAVDHRAAMVQRAQRRARLSGLDGRVDVRWMDIDGMADIPSDAYDAVAVTRFLHRLSNDEISFLLRIAYRALAPEGRFVAADLAPSMPRGSRVVRKLARRTLEMAGRPRPRSGYPLLDCPDRLGVIGFRLEETRQARGVMVVSALRPNHRLEPPADGKVGAR